MLEGQADKRQTDDQALWTVRLLRLTLTPAAKAAEVTELESVQLPDRELAIAVGHRLIDRHSHEVMHSIGLGLMLLPSHQPPAGQRSVFRRYTVSAEAREQARMLGVSGDVEAAVSRMAMYAAPLSRHPKANWRFEVFAMRVEKGVVTWFGRFDPADRPYVSRRASRRAKQRRSEGSNGA